MPESLLSMSLASLTFSRKHTFDQTFSRRVSHLRAMERRNARGCEELEEVQFESDEFGLADGPPGFAARRFRATVAAKLPIRLISNERTPAKPSKIIWICRRRRCHRTASRLARPSASPAQSRPFPCGAERSGTTLLRLLLDHHPEIAWSSEFEYSVDKLPGDAGFPDMDGYLQWLQRDRIFRMHGLQIDGALPYPALMDSFLRQKRGREGHRRDRTSYFQKNIKDLAARALHLYLLRDGRDVARSWIAMGWSGNMWSAMDGWLAAELGWQELRATLPEDHWIEIRHEDLVSDPAKTLTRICLFLGTEFDEAMFEYVLTPGTTYQLPDSRLAHQWKNKQSQDEIRQAEARAGALLHARGYELSGLPPLEITPAMERHLRLQNRMARLKRRVGEYGWPLTVGAAVSRRLRLCPMQYYFEARINRIVNAKLKR